MLSLLLFFSIFEFLLLVSHVDEQLLDLNIMSDDSLAILHDLEHIIVE